MVAWPTRPPPPGCCATRAGPRPEGPRPGPGALVGGVAGGAAIGFYLRNRSLYGSLTGAAYNQELFRFKPQDHMQDLLLSPGYALRLYDGLWVWTRFNLPRVQAPAALVAVPRVAGVLALAGLAVAAAGLLRPRPAADLPACRLGAVAGLAGRGAHHGRGLRRQRGHPIPATVPASRVAVVAAAASHATGAGAACGCRLA